jgi:hypothetical protein
LHSELADWTNTLGEGEKIYAVRLHPELADRTDTLERARDFESSVCVQSWLIGLTRWERARGKFYSWFQLHEVPGLFLPGCPQILRMRIGLPLQINRVQARESNSLV